MELVSAGQGDDAPAVCDVHFDFAQADEGAFWKFLRDVFILHVL